MSGILDYINPSQLALLGASSSLLQAGGPSRTPVSFGQALGQGIQGGLGGLQQAQQFQQMEQMNQFRAAQAEEMKRKAAMQAQQQEAMQRLGSHPSFAGVPQELLAAGFGDQAIERAFPKPTGADSPFAKINPKDFTPDSVRKFSMTRNPADLVAAAPQPQDDDFTRTLKAAGIKPDSPEWQKAMSERAKKLMTHQPPTAQVNVNSFTPASEVAQAEFMKSNRANYDALRNSPTVLRNIEAAKALIPSAKGFMGTGGETLLEAAKFLNNRLGMNVNTQGVKDAEELRSRVFFQLMENLKKMDAQPSQMQQTMMRDALGKLGTDPNALGAVLDAYGDVVKDKVSLHNAETQSALERGVKFPYDPIIKLPPGQPQTAPKAETFDALPPAVKFKGKTIRDTKTGKMLRSDGMSWKEVK
jgi:hypothetical protein